MSRFFSERFNELTPYVPGEQPKDKKYLKLNTNESPFEPSAKAQAAAASELAALQLYPDPTCSALRAKMASYTGLSPENVFVSNGSDEALNFAFMAFGGPDMPAVYPDITYGFYKVFAALNNLPSTVIPLDQEFNIPVEEFKAASGFLVIANPNAPTGILLSLSVIEDIVKSNPDRVVIVDEAYIDFGGESAVSLVNKYDNLLVVQTFSKSRSMAGARIGFAFGNKDLIADLETIKYSTNPYNINRVSQALAAAVMDDEEYTQANCRAIIKNREYLTGELAKLGFDTIPSSSNFVFTKNTAISGEKLYLSLKERGVLVRYFSDTRLRDFVRITIGTKEQMDVLLENIRSVLGE